MNCGKVIRDARKNKDLTQSDLASLVGCTRTTICDWEKGKYLPTDGNNICALEEALGFKNGYLYSILFPNPTAPRRRGTEKKPEETASAKTA